MRHWTLTTLREKLIKFGTKVVCHSRTIVFQMAEVAVPRELFRSHENNGNHGSSVLRLHGKACGKAQLATNRPPVPEKTEGYQQKSSCQSVEQAENREKSPNRSTLVVVQKPYGNVS